MARPVVEREVEVWDDSFEELELELDEVDIEITIAEAQLDLDSASHVKAFEAVVGRQIEAYRAYAALMEGRIEAATDSALQRRDADVQSIRAAIAAAVECLWRYRDLTNEVSDSLRAGVLAALDDLDHAAAQARSRSG